MKRQFETVDLNKVKTISLAKRKSLVSTRKMARVIEGPGINKFLDSLPGYLKANDFKELIKSIISARKKNKPVIIMAGGHVIKVGLGPIIIDLIKKGFVTGLCFNGAGLIHDSETAMSGSTSEDVAAGIGDGSFGMSRETASIFNTVVDLASKEEIGLGQAAGCVLNTSKFKYRLNCRCSR